MYRKLTHCGIKFYCFFSRQAYTSQFVALVMFGMMMCEDRMSKRPRYNEIIEGLRELPSKSYHPLFDFLFFIYSNYLSE